MKRLLITGACGTVANAILPNLTGKYELLLCDKKHQTSNSQYDIHSIDLTDYRAIKTLCEDIDCIIHLAADPSPEAGWDSLLPNNIIATQNIFRAASETGCSKVIFASSIQTMMGYENKTHLTTDMPAFPINLYGVSKAAGEALARYYSHSKNISIICLRFGWVLDSASEQLNLGNKHLDIILTYNDLNRLIHGAIHTDCHFGIFHGLSNNQKCYFNMYNTKKYLNYYPQDDTFKIARKKHGVVKQFISWVGL